MSIQDNINQALGIGTALLSQTGRAQTVREQGKAKQELKTTKEVLNQFEGPIPTTETAPADERAAWGEQIGNIYNRGINAYLTLGKVKEAKEFMGQASFAKEIAANARAELETQRKIEQLEAIKRNINGGKDGNN